MEASERVIGAISGKRIFCGDCDANGADGISSRLLGMRRTLKTGQLPEHWVRHWVARLAKRKSVRRPPKYTGKSPGSVFFERLWRESLRRSVLPVFGFINVSVLGGGVGRRWCGGCPRPFPDQPRSQIVVSLSPD